jgi:hypothetical protein
MTYLEAINKVLRRLREDEVSSPDSTAYSKLIGDFVNDAKRLVEDSWNWSGLRKEFTINTVADQRTYTLVGTSRMFTTLEVTNSTEKCFVNLGTQRELQEDKFINPATVTIPANYVYTGYNESAGGMDFQVYPVPNKEYNLNFLTVDRSDEFTTGTEVIDIPSLPVVQLAHAMAAEERGELGGTSTSKLYAIARATLSDAIAMDAARFPTETVWYDV